MSPGLSFSDRARHLEPDHSSEHPFICRRDSKADLTLQKALFRGQRHFNHAPSRACSVCRARGSRDLSETTTDETTPDETTTGGAESATPAGSYLIEFGLPSYRDPNYQYWLVSERIEPPE